MTTQREIRVVGDHGRFGGARTLTGRVAGAPVTVRWFSGQCAIPSAAVAVGELPRVIGTTSGPGGSGLVLAHGGGVPLRSSLHRGGLEPAVATALVGRLAAFTEAIHRHGAALRGLDVASVVVTPGGQVTCTAVERLGPATPVDRADDVFALGMVWLAVFGGASAAAHAVDVWHERRAERARGKPGPAAAAWRRDVSRAAAVMPVGLEVLTRDMLAWDRRDRPTASVVAAAGQGDVGLLARWAAETAQAPARSTSRWIGRRLPLQLAPGRSAGASGAAEAA